MPSSEFSGTCPGIEKSVHRPEAEWPPSVFRGASLQSPPVVSVTVQVLSHPTFHQCPGLLFFFLFEVLSILSLPSCDHVLYHAELIQCIVSEPLVCSCYPVTRAPCLVLLLCCLSLGLLNILALFPLSILYFQATRLRTAAFVPPEQREARV